MIPAIDLKAERHRRGMSLRQAAKAIGVELNLLSRAERGLTTPRPAAALLIADFYGHDVLEVWPLDDTTAAPEPKAKAA